MPLEPTPERKLSPDYDYEDDDIEIETDCCYKKMLRDDAKVVRKRNSLAIRYFCDECLIEFKDEIEICN